VAIDFETADHEPDSACSAGLVRVEALTVVHRESLLIQPPRPRVLFTHVHGITWEMVKDAAKFKDAWNHFTPLLDGASALVAQNASFDRRVLAACCRASGLLVPAQPFLCTAQAPVDSGALSRTTSRPSVGGWGSNSWITTPGPTPRLAPGSSSQRPPGRSR
jgi:DNA polymerase-3 subunit epsilon